MNSREERDAIASECENECDRLLALFNSKTQLFNDIGHRTEDKYDSIDRWNLILCNGQKCNLEMKNRTTAPIYDEMYSCALEMEKLMNEYHHRGNLPLVMMFLNDGKTALWDLRYLPPRLNYYWNLRRKDKAKDDYDTTNRVGLPLTYAAIWKNGEQIQKIKR